jgi:N-acetylmuramoyl-L-alanine amidase
VPDSIVTWPQWTLFRAFRRLWCWPRRAFAFLALLAMVMAPSAATAATYGQQVVAAVLLAEARGEGREGMVAVAEVMRRRADAQGTTMLGVARPGAFSSLNGKTHERLLSEFRHHPLFPAALEISRTAYNQPGRLRNITQGATHFTHKAERPYWALGHAPVAVIGNHAFYRLGR